LAQFLKLGRGTKDIDFLLRQLTANKESLEKIFVESMNIDCGDGLVFSELLIGQLSLEHKKYPGYRISMIGILGQIRNKVTIDIGVGDVVRPRPVDVVLLKGKYPLFGESIELSAYPPEYIFSEKFEAIIYLDEINGRMKDYYDCFRLISDDILDITKLKIAINETFEARGTELELISENLVEIHNTRWGDFLKKEKIKDISFAAVVEVINEFLKGNSLIS
jgi:hypothetical protein